MKITVVDIIFDTGIALCMHDCDKVGQLNSASKKNKLQSVREDSSTRNVQNPCQRIEWLNALCFKTNIRFPRHDATGHREHRHTNPPAPIRLHVKATMSRGEIYTHTQEKQFLMQSTLEGHNNFRYYIYLWRLKIYISSSKCFSPLHLKHTKMYPTVAITPR